MFAVTMTPTTELLAQWSSGPAPPQATNPSIRKVRKFPLSSLDASAKAKGLST